jgi:hypothetical protein
VKELTLSRGCINCGPDNGNGIRAKWGFCGGVLFDVIEPEDEKGFRSRGHLAPSSEGGKESSVVESAMILQQNELTAGWCCQASVQSPVPPGERVLRQGMSW